MIKENYLNLQTEKKNSCIQFYHTSYLQCQKLKKKIHKTNHNNNKNDEISKIQEDLKASIKNLYLSDQKKGKTIDNYVQLTTKTREEYSKIQQENNQII